MPVSHSRAVIHFDGRGDSRIVEAEDPDYEPREYDEDNEPVEEGIQDILDNLQEREKKGLVTVAETFAAQGAAWGLYAMQQIERHQETERQAKEAEDGWRDEPKEDDEPASIGRTLLPFCPACGWTIDYCDVHDDAELEIIRRHEDDDHTICDPDGCKDAMQKLIDHFEREEEDDLGGPVFE